MRSLATARDDSEMLDHAEGLPLDLPPAAEAARMLAVVRHGGIEDDEP